MNILSFETSCDETSVSVVQDGTKVLSCVTATSMNTHAETGGIIPENAARKQIEYILPVLEQALKKAFGQNTLTPQETIKTHIDAVAVTTGPGLIGSLLVGIETAKTIATLFDKPLIAVNHIKAHIYAAFLGNNTPQFPLLAAVVSGGHTDFVYMSKHGSYKKLGGTRDDAAGEAFDKCARLIGLGYPGGPAIAKAATEYLNKNPSQKLNLLPRPMIHDESLDVSFSGLKTAVARLVKTNENEKKYSQGQLAAEIQEAIIDSLINKIMQACSGLNIQSVVLCGGVSANPKLRSDLKSIHLFESSKTHLHVPEIIYCTDNAAMVGSFAFFNQEPQKVAFIRPNPELSFL